MIRFLLMLSNCVEEEDILLTEQEKKEGMPTWSIEKFFEMPVVPRAGESIYIGGNSIEVEAVFHDIEKKVVEVRCTTYLSNLLRAFSREEGDWKFDGSTEEEKQEFYRRAWSE